MKLDVLHFTLRVANVWGRLLAIVSIFCLVLYCFTIISQCKPTCKCFWHMIFSSIAWFVVLWLSIVYNCINLMFDWSKFSINMIGVLLFNLILWFGRSGVFDVHRNSSNCFNCYWIKIVSEPLRDDELFLK